METILTERCQTPDDTRKLAGRLAGLFNPNDVVLLQGNLGAGKTFLVKEICRVWQTTDDPSSPSFTIINYYSGPRPVNHFDFYRISGINELDNLGWEEMLENGAVTFIEWPQLIENQLRSYYKIVIDFEDSIRIFEVSRMNRSNGRNRM